MGNKIHFILQNRKGQIMYIHFERQLIVLGEKWNRGIFGGAKENIKLTDNKESGINEKFLCSTDLNSYTDRHASNIITEY